MTEQEFNTHRFSVDSLAYINEHHYPITGVDWEKQKIEILIDGEQEWVPYQIVEIKEAV